jgi:hypothetical protein
MHGEYTLMLGKKNRTQANIQVLMKMLLVHLVIHCLLHGVLLANVL